MKKGKTLVVTISKEEIIKHIGDKINSGEIKLKHWELSKKKGD